MALSRARIAIRALSSSLLVWSCAFACAPPLFEFETEPVAGAGGESGDEAASSAGSSNGGGESDGGARTDSEDALAGAGGGEESGDCPPHRADCDHDPARVCEVDLSQDPLNCGACARDCQGEPCQNGSCKPRCQSGFADCNGEPDDGCEVEIASSLSDCGACGAECQPAHADGECLSGLCHVKSCRAGFEDCDGDADNGCEAELSQPSNCGSCSNRCSENGGTPSCHDGSCTISCDEGRADCKNGASDGCETDLAVSATNCGSCGKLCPASGGTAACNAGTCGVSSCSAPYADCNFDAQLPGGNGCETNLSSDAASCNGCGNECYYPNGVGKCASSSCALAKCDAGYADCGAAPGCETQLGSTAHCRSCEEVCSNAHGTTACTASGCRPACALGWDDCDGKPENGCEASLSSVASCGACGQTCDKAHASASCASGSCAVASCEDGWGNCDDEPSSKNGCETNLRTLSNCGACGKACAFANAAASCASGVCTQGSCASSFLDCEPGGGCETALGTGSDCAACHNACVPAHGNNTCGGSPGSYDCKPSCDAGFASCDGNPDNGCEADLSSASSCGTCGSVCSGNAPLCIAGSCSSALVSAASGALLGNAGKLEFPYALTTPSGHGRLLVVVIASDGSSQSGSAISAVSYDDESLTLAKRAWSGERVTASIFYLADAALPAPGSHTLSIVGGDYVKIANVLELRGIDQENPLEASGGSAGLSCSNDDPSDALTTSSPNALVVSGVATFGSNLGSPSGTPQTPVEAYTNQAGPLGFKSGYVQNAAAGARLVGWDMSDCTRSAQALAAFRAKL